MKRLAAVLAVVMALQSTPVSAQNQERSADETREIDTLLEQFAADYRADPMAIDATFGIKIGEQWWTVTARRRQEAYAPPPPNQRLTFHRFGPHEVTLRRGAPAEPTWYFDIADARLLRLIAAGEVNAGTAGMRSFESERVGMMTEAMPRFRLSPGAAADAYLVESHFWTRGVPEVTFFGRDRSLPTHGASATALHATKDRRIAWFSIGPDEAANADPRFEFGQVPNLMIFTRGQGRLSLGDREIEVREGMSVFIPPYVRHVIRTSSDQPIEGILVLYGDNSEFAFGTSYPDFMRDLNAFYGSYRFRSATPPR